MVSLLNELPSAAGVGVDLSSDAIATAMRNGERHGVDTRISWLTGNFDDEPDGLFDMVVSNPPYIVAGEIAGLPPEVREYDPHLALDGGSDGLAAYVTLAARLPNLLKKGGHAVLELGSGQAEDVAELTMRYGMKVHSLRPDIAGIPRVLIARAP